MQGTFSSPANIRKTFKVRDTFHIAATCWSLLLHSLSFSVNCVGFAGKLLAVMSQNVSFGRFQKSSTSWRLLEQGQSWNPGMMWIAYSTPRTGWVTPRRDPPSAFTEWWISCRKTTPLYRSCSFSTEPFSPGGADWWLKTVYMSYLFLSVPVFFHLILCGLNLC